MLETLSQGRRPDGVLSAHRRAQAHLLHRQRDQHGGAALRQRGGRRQLGQYLGQQLGVGLEHGLAEHRHDQAVTVTEQHATGTHIAAQPGHRPCAVALDVGQRMGGQRIEQAGKRAGQRHVHIGQIRRAHMAVIGQCRHPFDHPLACLQRGGHRLRITPHLCQAITAAATAQHLVSRPALPWQCQLGKLPMLHGARLRLAVALRRRGLHPLRKARGTVIDQGLALGHVQALMAERFQQRPAVVTRPRHRPFQRRPCLLLHHRGRPVARHQHHHHQQAEQPEHRSRHAFEHHHP